DDYITKPFNIRLLKARIKNLIKGREALREKYAERLIVSPSSVHVESLDDQILDRLRKTLEANLDNSDFSVDLLSTGLNMSRMQLYRKLKALTGKSPIQVIRSFRLQRAAQLLETGNYNVSDVTYIFGYVDLRSFRQQFKKEFKMSPSAYLSSKSK
ncbi:MAG: DNA-binding response regulator, partial [Phaeodactylibacter sp.]|nr:DNA-binding response regulator [Phaeodactylibacter sp.]